MNLVSPFFDLNLLAAQICEFAVADVSSSQDTTSSGIVPVDTSFQDSNSPHLVFPLNNTTPGGNNPSSPTVPPFGFDNDPPQLNIFFQNFLNLIKTEQARVHQ